MGDSFSPLGLMYRAYGKGDRLAAQNLALSYFNIGSLGGYRHWLAKGARAGDLEAADELKRFETRKPHGLAKRIGRLRPKRHGEW